MAVTVPKNDKRASTIYFVGLGFDLVAILTFPTIRYEQYSLPVLLFLIAITFALTGGMGLGVRAGLWWVKWIFVAFIVWSTLNYIAGLFSYDMHPKTPLVLVGAVLRIWSAAIVARDLLRRPSSEEVVEVPDTAD